MRVVPDPLPAKSATDAPASAVAGEFNVTTGVASAKVRVCVELVTAASMLPPVYVQIGCANLPRRPSYMAGLARGQATVERVVVSSMQVTPTLWVSRCFL